MPLRKKTEKTPPADPTAAKLLVVNGVGILFFAFALYLLRIDAFEGQWDHDAGYYFMQSAYVARGLRPFIDFKTLYPPGFAVLNALPIALGLPRFFLTWAIPLLWSAAIGFLTFRFVGREKNPRARAAGWLAAALFPLYCLDFAGNHHTLELGVVFFGMLALVAFARGERRFFWAGAGIAGSFLVKQVGVLMLLPFLTQVRTKREAAELGVGFALPILACLAWLGFDFGKIQESMDSLGVYVASTAPRDLGTLFRTAVETLLFEVRRTPPGFYLGAALFALALVELGRLARRRSLRPMLWIGAWLAVACAYLSARLVNNYPHYTLNAWPAWVALAAASVGSARPALRTGALALAAFGIAFTFATGGDGIRDIQGKPYFHRWNGGNFLTGFLVPVAAELGPQIPPEATITPIGPEEDILFFLTERLPKNKDWAGYDRTYADLGDTVLLTDYGGGNGPERRAALERAGFAVARRWPEAEGWITLYRKAKP